MNKSATSINYEIRPCKFVERRMFLASISRILGAVRQGKDYQYIGFGGCSFTDFKLFHRELQIDKMISIEGDTYSDSKLDYNKPFNCIDIRRGQSDEVLPQIDLSIPSIIWLDYDGVLKNYMFTDVETIFHTVPAGSFFIFSCNRELKRGNYEELDDTWGFYVNGGKWSEDDDLGEAGDSYTITWAESDAPDAKTYVIDIPMNEDGNWIINKYGLEVFVDAEDYTWDEAQKYLDQGETAVKDFAKEKLGLGEPDKIDYHEFQGECAWVIYKLHYGDKSVSISWVISTGDITTILGKDLMETE